MTILLLFLGAILIVIGGLMLLVATFRVSIWWGIFCLVFAPLQIVFVFKYWNESRPAIFAQTGGLLLILAGLLVGGDTFMAEYKTQFNQYMQKAAPEQMQQLNELRSMMPGPESIEKSRTDAVEDSNAVVAIAPVTTQKVIHKCVDAKGHVTYTEQPCEGAQEKKVITIKEGHDVPLENSSGDVLDTVD